MLNLNNFKSIVSSLKGEDKTVVYFGNDFDIAEYTRKLISSNNEDIAKMLKYTLLEYNENYGILEDEILIYHKAFHLKGWKAENNYGRHYLIEINPSLRIYFKCNFKGICRTVKFLVKRE